MLNAKKCVDAYGERLIIGDRVIPIMSEAFALGLDGIVSKIEYCEQYDNYHITITDENGKILLKGVDASYYTTQERFNQRENENHVYRLTFCSNSCWSLTTLPLANWTDENYVFPDGTAFVKLSVEHVSQIRTGSRLCNCSDIFYFAVKDKVKFCFNEKTGRHYLIVLETNEYMDWISENHIEFDTDEELKKYIKEIIRYFNKLDLTNVNNKVIYSEDQNGQKFEKNLVNCIQKKQLI